MLLLAVAGCEPEPSPPSVLMSGTSADSRCEQAVVARAEDQRDGGAASGIREEDVYRACTFAELEAANAKLAEEYRYGGNLRTHVGRRCLRLISPYRGTRLCESL
jgi:hypothetical protein